MIFLLKTVCFIVSKRFRFSCYSAKIIRKMVSVMIAKKFTTVLIFLLLSIEVHAEKITGASLGEIHDRAFSGVTLVLNFLKIIFVVVGFALFGHSVLRLIKISKGEIQGASPFSAIAGMFIAAMLSSLGFWWIATSNSLKTVFTGA